MILPSFKRIYEKDYDQQYQTLISKLALSVNSGFETIFSALSRRLTFQDNIQSTIKDITLQVDGNGTPKDKTIFKLTSDSDKATGVIVLKATNLTNSSAYVNSSPFISWTQVQNGVQVDNVKGLIPFNHYTLRVLVI